MLVWLWVQAKGKEGGKEAELCWEKIKPGRHGHHSTVITLMLLLTLCLLVDVDVEGRREQKGERQRGETEEVVI